MSSLLSPRGKKQEDSRKWTSKMFTSTSSTQTSSNKRFQAFGGKKKNSSGALGSVTSQVDLSLNSIKNQREFQLHEISDMNCFEGETLKTVKKLIQKTSKAVTFFNTRYYKESYEIYLQVLKDILDVIGECTHRPILLQAQAIASIQEAPFASWTIRLGLMSLVDNNKNGLYPLHCCCTISCGDPYVMVNILRVDKRYREIFPYPEGVEVPAGSVELDINQPSDTPDRRLPIHLACTLACVSGANLSLVNMLLKAGADINAEDTNGETPFEIALENQNNSLCALLATQPELNKVPREGVIPFSLNFNGLGLNSFPEKLYFLVSNLQVLDLSKNPISSMPNALSLLVNLTTIRLADMNLRTFPNALLPLSKLQYVDLSNNLITHVPTQIECLVELKTIKLRNNKLNSLPSTLAKLPKLQKLAIDKNPLESIPKEVLSHGMRTLMSYLSQMDGQTNNWKRIKLLVLGEEATGCFQYKNKTKKGFKKRSTKTLSTDGLVIDNWTPDPSVEFQTWDFAGQQVFYPTHQFFLSSRCIYIVTFNTVNLNASRPKYWVRQIGAVARDKPPIFLVGTHIDDPTCNETVMLTAKSRLESLVNFRKHNIVDCMFISSKTGDGIKELVQSLINVALDHNMLKQMVPGNYLQMDQLIQKERSKHQWVRWSIYLKWAAQCNIGKHDLSLTTRFLHDVGTLIYFENVGLRDIVILDPQWLANVFASLITFNHQWIKDGILKTEDLPQVWKQYPKPLYPKLLMLLTKFGVASPLSGDRSGSAARIAPQYIVPSLLNEAKPEQAKDLWNAVKSENEVEFGRLYTFNFTFEFSKVLVALLHAENLRADCFWRYGMITTDLQAPGSQRGLIQWLPNSSQLRFSVRMDKFEFQKTQKLHLLRQIAEVIDSILEGFYCGSPSITREVLCSCCLAHPSSLLEGVYQYSLDALVDSVAEGNWIVYCRGVPTRPVDIRYLAPDIAFCDFPVIPTDQYEIVKEVGRGGFGVVYYAKLAGHDAAVKELLLMAGDESLDCGGEGDSLRKFQEFQQEVYVMSALDHINLVRLFGVSLNPLRMIMEWCGSGDLWHLLHPKNESKPNLSWKLRYRIALDIAKGMSFLQDVTPPIVHRDLRSPNIFLVSTNEDDPVCAKVADFGLSRHVENFLGETLPTWRWLAPEVIDFESQNYDERSDIYSFAIILWELATAEIPYDEYSDMAALDVRRGIITGKLRPNIPDGVDFRYATLMRQCWRNEPRDRLPFREAVKVLQEIIGEDPSSTKYTKSNAVDADLLAKIALPQLSGAEEGLANGAGSVTFVPELVKKKEKIRAAPVTCMLAVGRRIWCGFGDGYVSVFDAASQSPVAAFSVFTDSEVFAMVSTNIDTVWVASTSVKIFDAKKLQKKKTLPTKDVVLAMTNVQLSNTEYIWVCDFQGNLVVWNNLASTAYHRVKIGEPVYSMQQCGDKVWIGLYRKLLIYVAKTASVYATGDTNQLRSLLSFQDEMWGALNDSMVFVWDTSSISVIHSLEGHTGTVCCIGRVDDFIWTGGFDTNILVWDPLKHKCITEISGEHKGRILAITQCGEQVWTSSEDNIVCIWKLP